MENVATSLRSDGKLQRADILGCPVDNVSKEEALRQCLSWCENRSAGNHVVTINAYGVVLMREDERMRRAVLDAAIVVADGGSIMAAARLLGSPLKERVTGVELSRLLFSSANTRNLRFFFLGARRDVVEDAVAAVRTQFPGIVVAGNRDGYFRAEEEGSIVEEIRRSAADILLVALPNPVAEDWIYRNKRLLNVPVIIGVGGTFDVLAGRVKRAPGLVQRLYLEWMWRLLREPRKRWRTNIIYSPRFLRMLSAQWVSEKFQRRRSRTKV